LKKWQLVEINHLIRICDLVLKPFEKWLSMIIFYSSIPLIIQSSVFGTQGAVHQQAAHANFTFASWHIPMVGLEKFLHHVCHTLVPISAIACLF